MSHQCPVANCNAQVSSHVFMCARHWRLVPKPLQDAVYVSYRSTGRLSKNHSEAVRVVEQAESAGSRVELPPGTKALTLYQPWATLIIMGAKPWEFRPWNFTDKPKLRGLIGQQTIIHASAREIRRGELEDILVRIEAGESALLPDLATPYIRELISAEDKDTLAPRSVALGTARFGEPRKSIDVFRDFVGDSDRLDKQQYAWPVDAPVEFARPIPAVGAQGFWNWS